MNWKIVGLAILVCAAMVALLAGKDRSVDLANNLIEANQVRDLTAAEASTLRSYVTTTLSLYGVNKPVSINSRYRKDHINLYVVKTPRESELGNGNAAYVGSSDILFIDNTYFDLGQKHVFETNADELTEKVLSVQRVYAYFVIAHEIGHRQLHRNWTKVLGIFNQRQREQEADRFAIDTLTRLYSTEDLRSKAQIPAPISGLIGFSGKVTTLSRIIDHFSIAVSLLSDEIFDNPFPLLSGSSSHPAFFARLNALLEGLTKEAERLRDEDALRQLRIVANVTSATNYLVALNPTEIEFSAPFQYAYLDRDILFVQGGDGLPLLRIPLSSLSRGRQYQRKIPPFLTRPTVQYAWAGADDREIQYRRDGYLRTVDTKTGQTLKETEAHALFGDNSCVKQFVQPARPLGNAYVVYCVAQEPYAARIKSDSSIVRKRLRDLVSDVAPSDIEVFSFDINASGHPQILFAQGDQVSHITLTENLEASRATPVAIGRMELPQPDFFRNARIIKPLIVSDSNGASYLLYGGGLDRNISLQKLNNSNSEPVSPYPANDIEDLFSAESLYNQPLWIRSAHYVTRDRIIVNLEDAGVYLLNLKDRTVSPLRRHGFEAMEQIVPNGRGDWIYYKKYERRILIFREPNK